MKVHDKHSMDGVYYQMPGPKSSLSLCPPKQFCLHYPPLSCNIKKSKMTRKIARSCNPSTHRAERGPLPQVDQPGLYYETLSSPKRLKKNRN